MQVLDVVTSLARSHPESLLPCPVCLASVKVRNIPSHVEHTHPAAVLPGDVLHGRSRIGLRRTLRLGADRLQCGRRVIPLPAHLVGGRLEKVITMYSPSEGTSTSGSEIVRAGAYLQVGDLVVTCRRAPGVAKHWEGIGQGRSRRRGHVRLDAPGFAALVYALAARGDLRPRPASSGQDVIPGA